MTKHTQGPWFAVNIGTEDEPMMSVKAERIRGRGPTHEVAICATGDSPQLMETANAHLIAAAPDMLKALEQCQTYLPKNAGMVPRNGTLISIESVIAQAIAKAKGE